MSNWPLVELGQLAHFRSGGTPARSERGYWGGEFPWLTAKDLKSFWLSDSLEKLSDRGASNGTRVVEAGTLLILVRGMTLHKEIPVGVATRRVAFNQDVKALEPADEADGAFLGYFLKMREAYLLRQVSHSGHGTGRLATDVLAALPVPKPPLEEQRRIVAILSTWDRAIEQLERLIAAKERFKRGLMQQLLTGKRRFPEFGEPWKEHRLSELFVPVNRAVTEQVSVVLSISAKKGFELQKEKFSKVIAGKNLEKYVLLKRGEFAYNKGNSKTYPQGCIYRLDDHDEAAVPNVYFCFATRDTQLTSPDFFVYYFQLGLLNRELAGLINTGVRNNGLLNIYEKDFYRLTVRVPGLKEQQQTARVLRSCDNELGPLHERLAALKLQKRGLMQTLLSGKISAGANS